MPSTMLATVIERGKGHGELFKGRIQSIAALRWGVGSYPRAGYIIQLCWDKGRAAVLTPNAMPNTPMRYTRVECTFTKLAQYLE